MDASGRTSRHKSSSRSCPPGGGYNYPDMESHSKYKNKYENKQDKEYNAEREQGKKKKKDAELPPNTFRCCTFKCWCRECKCPVHVDYMHCYCDKCGDKDHQGRLRKTPKPRFKY